jgi:hypothetical protein
VPAVERCLAERNDRYQLLRTFWEAEVPYIHRRMPWIGYEYWDAEQSPEHRFLAGDCQRNLIREAVALFKQFCSRPPASACAPGYRANDDTHHAWAENGIRISQNGVCKLAPYFDRHGLLQISRTLDFEPATNPTLSLENSLRAVDRAFTSGIPAIVSVHSINFHSSIKNFRERTLRLLDQFLTTLESRYPDLLYIHDGDLWDIVNTGKYQNEQGTVVVTVKQRISSRSEAKLHA